MNGFLNSSQREYVLFHLSHHINLTAELKKHISFIENNPIHGLSGRILFYCSEKKLEVKTVMHIDGLPVLFPILNKKDFYFFDESQNLIFTHDVFKAIFYLLSGYQEYSHKASADQLGRFSFQDSIQNKLGITDKPIVNYYFDLIVEALEKYCLKHHIHLEKRRLFKYFGFILSHDIDLVDLYTKNFVIYKLKEIFRIRKSKLTTLKNFRLFIEGFLKYVNIIKKDNPYWNFTFLRDLEREHNFRSVFFFLDTGVLHSDAYYSFQEERLQKLFEYLLREKCEIGLHGPVQSTSNKNKMQSSLDKLKKNSRATILGARQHRLLWNHPNTAINQEGVGLKYDSSLGFAANEGFRNSYCLPFKLYNFDKNEMINIWEFPLNAMDVTLFSYQEYSPPEAMEKCIFMIHEIKRFGGVFSLLWHNSFFDENTYPGITIFYKELLGKIADFTPENVLGVELLDKMENMIS